MNDDLWNRVRGLGSETSGGSDISQVNRNNIHDLLKAMPVKVSMKDGKISN